MANQIIISDANPVRFVPVVTPEYRMYAGDLFSDWVLPYQKPDNYFQKWFSDTPIRLQFKANFGPLQIQILNCAGQIINTYVPVAKDTSLYDTGFTVYEVEFLPPAIAGTWYILVNAGLGPTLIQHISEPQIVAAKSRTLMMVEYWHAFNAHNIVYRTGIKFRKVVEAVIADLQPKAVKTMWIDQPLNAKVIDAIPYRVFRFILGDAFGVPDYIADQMNIVFCHTHVFLNGVQHTQDEGAAWEATTADQYARAGWRTMVRLTNNTMALRGENNNSPAQVFAVVYNIDTRVFGTFNAPVGSNIMQVTKVES